VRAAIELADIFRAAGPAYRTTHAGHLNLDQFKVMSAIGTCRSWSVKRLIRWINRGEQCAWRARRGLH
jgi:hypothetical protein